MKHLDIQVGEVLIEFVSHRHWVDYAKVLFQELQSAGRIEARDWICIDIQGRICNRGLHFMQARDENAYPIRVFAVRDPLNLVYESCHPKGA